MVPSKIEEQLPVTSLIFHQLILGHGVFKWKTCIHSIQLMINQAEQYLFKI